MGERGTDLANSNYVVLYKILFYIIIGLINDPIGQGFVVCRDTRHFDGQWFNYSLYCNPVIDLIG